MGGHSVGGRQPAGPLTRTRAPPTKLDLDHAKRHPAVLAMAICLRSAVMLRCMSQEVPTRNSCCIAAAQLVGAIDGGPAKALRAAATCAPTPVATAATRPGATVETDREQARPGGRRGDAPEPPSGAGRTSGHRRKAYGAD